MSAARIIPAALLATLALTSTAAAPAPPPPPRTPAAAEAAQVVGARDAGAPATFNAMFGPGTCETDEHGVALDDAVAKLQKHGRIPQWRFSPREFHVREGEPVV